MSARRLRDAFVLGAVLATAPVSGRPVRPLTDENRRPLPVTGSWTRGCRPPTGSRCAPACPRSGRGSCTPTAEDAFIVRAVEPERALVLGAAAGELYLSTWAFVIEPVEEQTTRLVARSRVAPGSRLATLLRRVLLRPIHCGM